MTSMTDDPPESTGDYTPPVKLKKATNEDDHNDLYCFECHDEGEVICCDSCPRVYHSKCLGLVTLPEGDWTCPECQIIQSANVSEVSANFWNHHSRKDFHTMLKFALRRMKSHPHASPFMQPVDCEQMPEYLDYIIHPMDLNTIEKCIDLGKYTSTDAFLADVKWIVHNSVVFNGNQSKITGIARALLKIARHEMIEIEICSECYLRSAQPLSPDWFAEPCTVPHTLCWAKMRGYQPWPAKVLRIVNDEVDVRFFGQHDRAWVPINNCFVLSKEYPIVEKKKSNANFDKSLSELQVHIDRLKKLYGHFNYAPPQTSLSKTKPFKFVSIIDESRVPSYVIAGANNITLRSSSKCTKQARSPLPQIMTDPLPNSKLSTKRPSENSIEQEQIESVKRARVLSRPSEDTNSSASRIVLRIRKTSDDISSCRSEASTSSSSSHQVTVHIKEPLTALTEDEEIETDNDLHESSNDFDMIDQVESKLIQDKSDNDESILSPKPQPLSLSFPRSQDKTINSLNNQLSKQDKPTTKSVQVDEADVRCTISELLNAVETLKQEIEIRNSNKSTLASSKLKSNISPSSKQLQYAERRQVTKHSRKPTVQHRILSQTKSMPSNTNPPASFDQISNDDLSPPPLVIANCQSSSDSPPNTTIAEEIANIPKSLTSLPSPSNTARTISIDSSSVKSEPVEKETPAEILKSNTTFPVQSTSSSLPARLFLISPPGAASTVPQKSKTMTIQNASNNATATNSNTLHFAPRIPSTVAQKTNRPSTIPVASSTRQQPSATQKRPVSNSMYPATAPRNNSSMNPSHTRMVPPNPVLPTQTFEGFSIDSAINRRANGIPVAISTPPLSTRNQIRIPSNNLPTIRPPIDDIQTPNEIQSIIKGFNEKFQQLLTDFTVKIESTLESNRLKYEKELEETHRSYRSSMNELRNITTQQVQEMHRSLELQYWTRINDMRNRYETALQQQYNKNSKQLNGGGPR